MVSERIPDALVETVAHSFGIAKAEVGLDTHLIDDLHMDDLDFTELAVMLEDVFTCTIPSDILNNITTVSDFNDFIQWDQIAV